MAVCLVPKGDGPTIVLYSPIVLLGRHATCDVRIESRNISRRHCAFIQLHDKLVIRDLGSTNGIYHNGKRITEAILAVDDEVQIANLQYRVQVRDEAADDKAENN